MKKYLFLVVFAATMVACDNELEEVNNIYEEISAAKDEKKVNPNFLIFKDRTQTGKGETR
jgi:hypothetical protein